MNTAVVAILMVGILAVGVYIGISNLAQQYAVAPSGSNASQYACTAELSSARVNQVVRFDAAVPRGTPYYWSAPDATVTYGTSQPLTARYAAPGIKTTYLFYAIGTRWYRTSCTVQIQ